MNIDDIILNDIIELHKRIDNLTAALEALVPSQDRLDTLPSFINIRTNLLQTARDVLDDI
jgi:hypothetical protein